MSVVAALKRVTTVSIRSVSLFAVVIVKVAPAIRRSRFPVEPERPSRITFHAGELIAHYSLKLCEINTHLKTFEKLVFKS